MSDFRLPENAEASLVGCLLLCPETRTVIAPLISADDFASAFYAALFSVVMAADELDSVTLQEGMKAKGFEIPDGFYRELGDAAVVPAHVELYARLLREAAMRRKLLALADSIRENQDLPPREVIAQVDTELRRIESAEITSELIAPSVALSAFYDHRERVDNEDGAVSTGFAPLDKMFSGGLLRSCVYVLAARPGMGKTTFALQIADHIAEGGGVLFVSLEMSVEQLMAKRISRLTGIPSDRVLLQRIDSEAEYSKIVAAGQQLQTLHLHISGNPSVTVSAVKHMARRIPALRCIMIDYFGLLTTTEKRVSRYEAMTAISRDLKTLAGSLDVPIVVLAQLNRENTGRQDKRPQLSDLRDTGALEQDADSVIMLHRQDYYEMTEEPLGSHEAAELEIIVRKSRFGSVGTCKAGFFPATGRIVPTDWR